MHVSAYFAYQPICVEISLIGQSIQLAMESEKQSERFSLILSRNQTEVLMEGLQAAIKFSAPEKQYPDITLKKMWEVALEKEHKPETELAVPMIQQAA